MKKNTNILLLLLLCTLMLPVEALGAPDPQVENFAEIANKRAKPILKLLGEGYSLNYDSNRRLVFISPLGDKYSEQSIQELVAFSDAFRSTLNISLPKKVIIIVLPTMEDSYRIVRSRALGLYYFKSRTLISLDRGRTLRHEFTHALHHGSFEQTRQLPPIWIMEGLASLFEVGEIVGNKFEPKVENRLRISQSLLRKDKLIPLETLFKLEQSHFEKYPGPCYSQSRYLMLYLHRKGLLAKWLANYEKMYAQNPDGKKALEKTLKRKIVQIERNWKKWLGELKLPWGEQRAGRASLGMQLKDTPSGIKVAGCLPESPAAKAGLIKSGDYLLAINGRKVSKAIEAIGVIHQLGAMQTVSIKIKRNNRIRTIYQPLGKPSAGLVK